MTEQDLQVRLEEAERRVRELEGLADEAQHMVDLSKRTCITSQDANYIRAENWLARYDALRATSEGQGGR